MELIERPIFVLGMAKSGTSLVCQILNNHLDFMLDFEIPLIIPFIRTYQQTVDPNTRVRRFIEQMQCDELCKERYEVLIKNKEYHNMIRQLIGGMHSGWHKGKRWGSTNKGLINHHDSLQKLFPESTFLLVLRDPRDVWCSLQAWVPDWPPGLLQQWKTSLPLFIKKANFYLGEFMSIKGTRNYIVKYEDIIENPDILFHKLNTSPPHYPLTGIGKVYKARHLPLPDQTRSFPDRLLNRKGRWRQELDQKTADLIVAGCKVFKAGFYIP